MTENDTPPGPNVPTPYQHVNSTLTLPPRPPPAWHLFDVSLGPSTPQPLSRVQSPISPSPGRRLRFSSPPKAPTGRQPVATWRKPVDPFTAPFPQAPTGATEPRKNYLAATGIDPPHLTIAPPSTCGNCPRPPDVFLFPGAAAERAQ